MGKAADNERIKLRATYYNVMSASVTVVAILVPTLAFLPTLGARLLDVFEGQASVTADDIAKFVVDAIAFLAALYCAAMLRRAADQEIQKLED